MAKYFARILQRFCKDFARFDKIAFKEKNLVCMSSACEFCHREFASKSNLLYHQRSAKYCLDLRNQNTPKRYKCEDCGKFFTQRVVLLRHLETCSETLEKRLETQSKLLEIQKEETAKLHTKISALEKEIEGYKLRLAENDGKITVYKERPGIIHNTNTQYVNPKILTVKCDTISPLTIEKVKQEIDSGSYSYEMYIRGERGLVDFIATLIKSEDEQRSYVCTDTARNKFHRLIETREWKEDNGANFLNKIFDQLRKPATDYYQKINAMSTDPEERDTGDFLMEKTKKMFFGITSSKSKNRAALFNKIRSDVKTLASI